MKDRDFLVIQYDMMTKLHLKPGPMRDLFAIIYNYSKDGIHTYRASMDVLAEQIGVSERYAIDLVNNLLASGYINREQKVVICTKGKNKESKHAKYEYTTNYEQLLARADEGEDIRPLPMKKRVKKGEESSPIFEGGMGEESSSKRVNFSAIMDEESSPKWMKKVHPFEGVGGVRNMEGISKDNSLSVPESAPAREAEEREIYKIFFFRNAADPAAELRRFMGFYQSRGWQAKDGMSYDTPTKRTGLAYAWEFKCGKRLPDSELSDKFFAFLRDLYDLAAEKGGINPALFLDQRTLCNGFDGGFFWRCRTEVKLWVEKNLADAYALKVKHFGEDFKILYMK